MKADVEAIGVGEGWYVTCQNRKEWYRLCREGVEEVAGSRQMNVCSAVRQSLKMGFVCLCGRQFRRKGDLTRHKRFCASDV